MSVDAIARLDAIRERVNTDGRVRTTDLARELAVSEMTIRRDLDTLADAGAVRRVRGGALAAGPEPFAARYGRQSAAKDRIADKLVDLVGEGGAIGLDASSTMQRLGARLQPVRDLTVVTNGPECFKTLSEHAGVTALLTGAGSTAAPAAWSVRWRSDRPRTSCSVGSSPRPPRSTSNSGPARSAWRRRRPRAPWPRSPDRSSWPSTPRSWISGPRPGA